MILVSICCLTYNHKLFIKECLEGFVNQQCNFDFEVLIHDDASTDGTSDIIREYQQKYPDIIKAIIQTENQFSKGIGVNRVYNFPRAKGKYIALCEGDDYWTDSLKLQKQVDFLENHSEVVVCYHDRSVLKFNGELIKAPFKMFNNLKETTIIESNKMIDIFMPLLTMMLRTESVREYMKLDVKGVFGGDTFLRAFLSTKGKAAYLNFDGAVYRKHGGGIFTSLNNKIDKCKKAIQTREQILARIVGVSKKNVYISILKNYIVIFLFSLKNLKVIEAIRVLPKVLKYSLLVIFSKK